MSLDEFPQYDSESLQSLFEDLESLMTDGTYDEAYDQAASHPLDSGRRNARLLDFYQAPL